jgi:hypothetical protein
VGESPKKEGRDTGTSILENVQELSLLSMVFLAVTKSAVHKKYLSQTNYPILL